SAPPISAMRKSVTTQASSVSDVWAKNSSPEAKARARSPAPRRIFRTASRTASSSSIRKTTASLFIAAVPDSLEIERKGGAAQGAGRRSQHGPMTFQNLAGDRQTQPHPSWFRTGQGIEQCGEVVVGDAW